jgi:LacI family transcriptional regulator
MQETARQIRGTMGKAIIRLKDIADKTGFSTNTVSLALRDSPRIPEATRAIIRQAADALNYLPNQIAKSLVSRETKTVGLVLTDITNPVLTRVAQAVQAGLAARGYGILLATSSNQLEEEKRALALFRSRQVDGMLIYPTNHRLIEHLRVLRAAGYPIVLLVGDPDAGIDAVSIDERAGAHKAVKHLTDLGHRRIGLIDAANPLGNSEKREGYLKALAEAGIAFDTSLVVEPRGHDAAAGYFATDRLMQREDRPTALFAGNDSQAIGALSWARTHDIAVPEQFAVIGFDNIEFGQYASVPLSSVDYAVDRVTDLAIDRLMELIAAPDRLPPPTVTQIEPDLVVRRSTSAPNGKKES